jgi:hypothetical protein
MFSKEESKKIRLEFWDRFEQYSALRRRQRGKPAKWTMNKTGIKQMKLKFHFDETFASVGIDIETRNTDKRIELFGKLEELKSILEKYVNEKMNWELDYRLPTGKSISRINLVIDNLSIYNQDCWPEVFSFFFKKMMKIEQFFEEYREVIRDSDGI